MGPGVYPFPIGEKGVSMVDIRDIAQIAAGAVVRRAQAANPLPSEVINLVGPQALTGPSIAQIWSDLLRRPVKYAGNVTTGFETQLAHHAPSWMAMDMRLMLDRFCSDGMAGSCDDVAKMAALLGRPPRSYAHFAAETLLHWQAA